MLGEGDYPFQIQFPKHLVAIADGFLKTFGHSVRTSGNPFIDVIGIPFHDSNGFGEIVQFQTHHGAFPIRFDEYPVGLSIDPMAQKNKVVAHPLDIMVKGQKKRERMGWIYRTIPLEELFEFPLVDMARHGDVECFWATVQFMVGHGIETALHTNYFFCVDIWIGNEKVFITLVEEQAELFHLSVLSVPIGPIIKRIVLDFSVQPIFGKGDIGDAALVITDVEGIEDPALEGFGLEGVYGESATFR